MKTINDLIALMREGCTVLMQTGWKPSAVNLIRHRHCSFEIVERLSLNDGRRFIVVRLNPKA